MRTLKFGILIFAVIAFFSSCQKTDEQDDITLDLSGKKSVVTAINEFDCGQPASVDLIAAQHYVVGKVEVVLDGADLKITYRITDGLSMIKETHLSVEPMLEMIPQTKKGNPKVGNFEYKMEHDPYVSEYTYIVPAEGLSSVYIAAHAVVKMPGGTCETLAELEARLPDHEVDIAFVQTKVNSYYDLTLSNAGDFSGVVPGWCVDNNGKPVNYPKAMLVSSYSTTYPLGDVVPLPENLDLLNYLMNVHYPAKSFPVIQAAIWKLMNGFYNNPSGGINLTAEQLTELDAVIEDVMANGEGFEPECNHWIVILVDSGDRSAFQNVFFLAKRRPFYKEETAWGAGSRFVSSTWAMYFKYCVASE